MIFSLLTNPKTALRFGGAVVALSLIMALIAQFGFGLAPCELCILQRYPAFVAVAFAIIAEFWKQPRLLLSLFMFACFITADIAFYHTGVEQGWWPGPTSCSGSGIDSAMLTLEQLKAQIMAAPVVRCDKPAFELMGITMASANVVFSLGLTIWAFMSLRLSRSK